MHRQHGAHTIHSCCCEPQVYSKQTCGHKQQLWHVLLTHHFTNAPIAVQVMENSRDADEPLSFEIGAGEITGNPLFQVRAIMDLGGSAPS